MIRGLSLALIFLTRIPVPVRFEPRPQDWGRSVFFFPFVGLIIGLGLAGLDAVFPHGDSGVLAALLLAVWALTTGGLHLDGLADAADAWIGGYGDREKTLAIMKDPRSGPMAIMVMILTLLVKFAALKVVVEQNAWEMLVWTPVMGRAAILMMLVTTPYVRPEGIGVAHADYMPRRACGWLLLGIVGVTLWKLGGDGIILICMLGMSFVGLRQLLLERLGGVTGDTLGATCELTEAVTLVILALLIG